MSKCSSGRLGRRWAIHEFFEPPTRSFQDFGALPVNSARCRQKRTQTSARSLWSVDTAPLRQHHDELSDSRGAGFRPSCILDPVDERTAVGAVEGCEECLQLRIGADRALKVRRHARGPLRCVGRSPAPVRLGALDFAQAARFHTFVGDETFCCGPIDLGPFAACRAHPARRSGRRSSHASKRPRSPPAW